MMSETEGEMEGGHVSLDWEEKRGCRARAVRASADDAREAYHTSGKRGSAGVAFPPSSGKHVGAVHHSADTSLRKIK